MHVCKAFQTQLVIEHAVEIVVVITLHYLTSVTQEQSFSSYSLPYSRSFVFGFHDLISAHFFVKNPAQVPPFPQSGASQPIFLACLTPCQKRRHKIITAIKVKTGSHVIIQPSYSFAMMPLRVQHDSLSVRTLCL